MLYLPVGKYTDEPYYLEELGAGIHSVEELCYYLKENAASLEDSIMRPSLCSFIIKELELVSLGEQLSDLVANKGSLASFVRLILEECGYVSREELRSIDTMLRKNSSMGIYEKRKSHGDYHLCAGRYLMAEREYRQALSGMDPEENRILYASTLHNLGCALAGMFLYDQAADCFKRSYEAERRDETYMHYLGALRLGRSREEYAGLINTFKLDHTRAARLENEIMSILEERNEQEDIEALRKGGNAAGKLGEILEGWKSEMRSALETEQ